MARKTLRPREIIIGIGAALFGISAGLAGSAVADHNGTHSAAQKLDEIIALAEAAKQDLAEPDPTPEPEPSVFQETFTGTDDVALADSTTTDLTWVGPEWAHLNNQASPGGSTRGVTNYVRTEEQTDTADQYAEVTVTTLDGNNSQGGPLVRYDVTTDSAYMAMVDNASGSPFVVIRKTVGGTRSNLSAQVPVTVTLPQVLRIEAAGDTLTAFWGGEQVAQITDTTITGTHAGIYGHEHTDFGSGLTFDDFTLSDLEPNSTPTPTPTPTDPPDTGLPTPETVGPTGTLTPSGSVTSSSDGQIIEDLEITGQLTVRHDNVTVRNVLVHATARYSVRVQPTNGVCPEGASFDYVEVEGSQLDPSYIPFYTYSCGALIDHTHLHDVGRGFYLGHGVTVQNSYVISSKTWEGAHRSAMSFNSVTNGVARNNVLRCENTGCSAALAIYGDFGTPENILADGNLFATTGSYCVYGGSVDADAYPDGVNIDIINNRFSTEYFPKCGRYGWLTAHDEGERGNEQYGNVWHETGEPID